MKNMNIKTGVSFALLAVMAVTMTSSAPKAIANDNVPNAGKILITSDNLDDVLFANNPDTIDAMNAVMRAKDQLNIARAQLLPSLSLNVIMTISNPPMFFVNSISCLVPFIFPGNWFDARAARAGEGAAVMGFYIARLNAYSQAYALTEEVGGDTEVYGAMQDHFARFQQYVDNLQLQADLGVIPQFDVERAKVELGKYEMDLSALRQLIDEERAAIRKLFGFSITQDFDIQMAEVGPSPYETSTAAASLDDIVARAPERQQIDELIVQARAQVHSAVWAFLGGCQGNQGGFGNGAPSSAFSLSTGVQVNIGFGYYAQIQLAKRNVVDMQHRQQELKLELGSVLETSIADINEIKIRDAIAQQNLATSEAMLAEQSELLPLGRVSVKDMLDTYSALSVSKTTSLANHTALQGHRITLKRVTLEDGFFKVYNNSRRALQLGGGSGSH
jgi:outer membrane protein TolC